MRAIRITLSPALAGSLGLEAHTASVELADDQALSLREVLRRFDRRSPGALLEPGSNELHRYIHAYVNRRRVCRLDQPVHADDVVRLEMRLIEGG